MCFNIIIALLALAIVLLEFSIKPYISGEFVIITLWLVLVVIVAVNLLILSPTTLTKMVASNTLRPFR